MPHCQAFQNEVDRLRDLLAEQTAECGQLDSPLEVRLCLQIRAAIAAQLSRAEHALENCQRGLPQPGIHRAEGRLPFLRVHDTGGFGPDSDHLDVVGAVANRNFQRAVLLPKKGEVRYCRSSATARR
jgi:hypothetical protein